jgi:hypothetical protein
MGCVERKPPTFLALPRMRQSGGSDGGRAEQDMGDSMRDHQKDFDATGGGR